MADITDAQVNRFANAQLRPMMDRLYSTWMEAIAVNQNYVSGGIGARITAAGPANFLADGSDVDGRTRITGDDIFNAVTAINAFIAFITGGGAVPTVDRKDVVTKPHVNRL